MGAFMKYRRIFQMILVCITGILLSGCRGQIEEQKKKKQDTHQDSTIQIYKTVGKCFDEGIRKLVRFKKK